MLKARDVLSPGTIEYAENEYLAASRRDALLILTEWEQFAKLDLQKLRTVMKQPIVIDGRNLFSPSQMAAAGFLYYSVGRPLQITENMPHLWHGIHLAPQPISVVPPHRAGVFA